MTTREAKRIWRHRQAAIEGQIRNLRNAPERRSREGGIFERMIRSYRREWIRYQQMIHANDRRHLSMAA